MTESADEINPKPKKIAVYVKFATLKLHYFPGDTSKCNWNENQELGPTIWLTSPRLWRSSCCVDHKDLQARVPTVNCNHSRRWGGGGSSWKPQRREQLIKRGLNMEVKSSQSLSLPPTRQDMPQAHGMPHIYFPSFSFLITTHTLHKNRHIPDFSFPPLPPL